MCSYTLAAFVAASTATPNEPPALAIASIFTDHMVLQRDRPVPVWGSATPGVEVTVEFAGQKVSATAGPDGRWAVSLQPMPASAEARTLLVRSSARDCTSAITNVLVGDVWLCSGQSNMELALKNCENAEADIAAACHPLIRFFNVRKHSAETPQDSCEGAWRICSPATAGDCFGVSFHFAVAMRGKHDVPIGLINSAWSGACAETWIPLDSLKNHPELHVCVEAWEKYKTDYPAALAEAQTSRKAGQRARNPKSPTGPEMSVGMLYNGMLHPLIPFALKGVCWYQGENNVMNTDRYRTTFPFLIREWRRLWNAQPAAMPFLFVQIANFGERQKEPEDNTWTRLRDAQRTGLKEPHTAMVTAIDIGSAFHPKNKKDVGRRLALAARANVYGEHDLVWCGPMLKSVEFTHTSAVLSFDHIGGGLEFKGGHSEGFALAGADRTFVWADAAIEGNKVTVATQALVKPAAVRYAWGTNPLGNLYNKEGLPAFPFRTDDWESPVTSTDASRP